MSLNKTNLFLPNMKNILFVHILILLFSAQMYSQIEKKNLDKYSNTKNNKATQVRINKINKLLNLLKNPDEKIRWRAANELVYLSDSTTVVPLLEAMKNERKIEVKNEIIKALGETRDVRAFASIYSEIEDGLIKRDALVKINKNLYIDTLFTFIKGNCNDKERYALETLGFLGNASTFERLISTYKKFSVNNRYCYDFVLIESLNRIVRNSDDKKAIGQSEIALLNDSQENVRDIMRSVIALSGNSFVIDCLFKDLDDKNMNHSDRKLAAKTLLSIINNNNMKHTNRERDRLYLALIEKDADVIYSIYDYYIKLGIKGTEDSLIEILNIYGYRNMAQDFINSGNDALEKAGKKWAEANGYRIESSMGNSPKWGGH